MSPMSTSLPARHPDDHGEGGQEYASQVNFPGAAVQNRRQLLVKLAWMSLWMIYLVYPVKDLTGGTHGTTATVLGWAALAVFLAACLSLGDQKRWPNVARRRAERDMFVQSLGAALQNLLLAAGEGGIVGYLKGAPLFCADAVRAALELPSDWEPTFLVLLGYPHEDVQAEPRDPVDADEFLIER